MKKISILLLSTFFLLLFAGAQEGLYLGYEGVYKWDNFIYASQSGESLNHMSLGLMTGGYLGRKYRYFSVEGGYYWFFMDHPDVRYNFEEGRARSYTGGGNGATNHLIAFRIAHDFYHRMEHWFIKPGLGFGVFIMDDTSYGSSGGGTIITHFDDDPETNYTVYKRMTPIRVYTGLESSLEFGYRIRKRFDVYLKGSAYSIFQTPLCFYVSHYNGTETEHAMLAYGNVTLGCQLGLRFYFRKPRRG